MPRYKDEPPAVRVYTVCDESRVVMRNMPALGCGDELLKLFSSYGDVEEFAKRKLNEYAFPGNRLQVSYGPEFETPSDNHAKLEGFSGCNPFTFPFRLWPKDKGEVELLSHVNNDPPITRVSADKVCCYSRRLGQ